MVFSAARLISVRAELKQSVVDKAVDHWRRGLRTRVRDKGNTLNSCLIESLLLVLNFRLTDLIFR